MVNTFRESDFVARYGGEEFVAILPNTFLEEGCKTAERIRHVLATTPHKAGDLELRITASIGVKEVQDHETDAEFLQKADKALYAAKNGGRNCICYHDGTSCQRYVPTAESVIPDQEATAILFEDDPSTTTTASVSDNHSWSSETFGLQRTVDKVLS